MTALTAESGANNNLLLQKYVGHNNRRSTDKYWIGLFVVVFITWIASWQYLAHHKNDYKIDPINSPTLKIPSQFADDAVAHKIDPHNSTNTNITSEYASSYWGKCWFFDTITFNVGFLNANYQRGGPIVICMNIIFCVGLIIYGLASLPINYTFSNQIKYFGRTLLVFLIYYRFLMYLPNRSDVMSLIPYDKNITFWILPELVFFIVWSTRSKSDGKDDKENNDDDDDDDDDEKISFYKFVGYVGLIGITLFASLEILMLTTTAHIYQLGWDNPLFYLIAVGSCYVGLTFFYFGLMVISCATSISFDKQSTSLKDLSRAFFVVIRYHFGTACYHATIIFPRIHTTFVINESEFKKIPESITAVRRFGVAHCKIHNVSPILTAISGRNHSGSIRELLRLFNADSEKVNNFQGFANLSKKFSAIIIGANSLILIMLWAHFDAIGPRFMMGTWIMYLAVLFFNYIFMRAHDAAADTIWLHVYTEEEVIF